jgi:hypothetical protein
VTAHKVQKKKKKKKEREIVALVILELILENIASEKTLTSASLWSILKMI